MPLKSVASALVRLSTPLAPLKPVRMAARLTPDDAHKRIAGAIASNEFVGVLVAVLVGETVADAVSEPETLEELVIDAVPGAVAVTDAVKDELPVDAAVGDPDGVRDAVPVDVRVAETGERLAVCVGV